ncbi:hypothetical protein QBC34DRAFT_428872 [Podospora aff. communis PSN243]|uniref:Uncharacterized protein n=1 Tax=Podospora aff. communis PSN243 TaxID=3040156 RepID=A0AAV9GB49_9PEZI|nr:hypothetical protein QBC34DRAFT_428872 [Podospora aff. communis PSN243]
MPFLNPIMFPDIDDEEAVQLGEARDHQEQADEQPEEQLNEQPEEQLNEQPEEHPVEPAVEPHADDNHHQINQAAFEGNSLSIKAEVQSFIRIKSAWQMSPTATRALASPIKPIGSANSIVLTRLPNSTITLNSPSSIKVKHLAIDSANSIVLIRLSSSTTILNRPSSTKVKHLAIFTSLSLVNSVSSDEDQDGSPDLEQQDDIAANLLTTRTDRYTGLIQSAEDLESYKTILATYNNNNNNNNNNNTKADEAAQSDPLYPKSFGDKVALVQRLVVAMKKVDNIIDSPRSCKVTKVRKISDIAFEIMGFRLVDTIMEVHNGQLGFTKYRIDDVKDWSFKAGLTFTERFQKLEDTLMKSKAAVASLTEADRGRRLVANPAGEVGNNRGNAAKGLKLKSASGPAAAAPAAGGHNVLHGRVAKAAASRPNRAAGSKKGKEKEL